MTVLLLSHRLTHHRISALLALFAIGLLFIAPDISKILEQQRMSAYGGTRMGMMAMQSQSVPPGDQQMAGALHQHHHSPPPSAAETAHAISGAEHQHSSHSASEMAMMDDFSCGYCELLVHLPMLVWIFIPLVWLMLLATRFPPPPPLPLYPLCWFPGNSQPRAPPVTSFLSLR